jgi:hypothetical protein
MSALIYHGTPMTPRAALLDVCAGRAMCVSFHRPDDVQAVETISPAIMYDNGAFSFWRAAQRAGAEWAEDRDWMPFLSMAGAAPISAGKVGSDSRYAGRTVTNERWASKRLAVRSKGRTALAYGWAARSPAKALRALRQGVLGLDRTQGGQPRLSQAHGRGSEGFGQSLASSAHDARNGRCVRLSLHQCGQHQLGAERVEI